MNPSPTGERSDPFGRSPTSSATRRRSPAANGYSVTGRAILDFGGTYPSTVRLAASRAVSLYGETGVHVTPRVRRRGRRSRRERARRLRRDVRRPTATNSGAFVEARASGRAATLYVNGGLGVRSQRRSSATRGRRALSVAAYLRQPSAQRARSATRSSRSTPARASRSRASARNCRRCSRWCRPRPASALGVEPSGRSAAAASTSASSRASAGGRGAASRLPTSTTSSTT